MWINMNMRRFGTWLHLLGKSHMSGGDLCEENSHWGNFLRRYTDAGIRPFDMSADDVGDGVVVMMVLAMIMMTMLCRYDGCWTRFWERSPHLCDFQHHISVQIAAVSVCLVAVCHTANLCPSFVPCVCPTSERRCSCVHATLLFVFIYEDCGKFVHETGWEPSPSIFQHLFNRISILFVLTREEYTRIFGCSACTET